MPEAVCRSWRRTSATLGACASIAGATRVDVAVQADHLEKLMRPSRQLAGITELVWNALDAEATEVAIHVYENALDGVDSIEVVDNGHGMTRESALEEFSRLGGSWKREKRVSKNGKRHVAGVDRAAEDELWAALGGDRLSLPGAGRRNGA